MTSPKFALLAGVAAAVVAQTLGQPTITSLTVGALVFMAMGGIAYAKMVIKYLPRELW